MRVEDRPASLVVHPVLVLDDRAGALVDLVTALVLGQPLDLLQPVRLHAGLQRVAHHAEQVDEQAGLDQLLQQRLVGAVLGRQRLERRSFGVVVVVHVHAGEAWRAGRRGTR